MTRRIAALILSTAMVVAVFGVGAVAAVEAPLPTSMAAVGDSITRAASSDGDLGVDAPRNSWSTGWNETVNSHYLRLLALNPSITAHNHSVSGAKMAHLEGQIAGFETANLDPDYLTVLIGGNDLCTDTIQQMTPVADFRGQFIAAMDRLYIGDPEAGIPAVSPNTSVYVVSIPDVHQLWELFKSNFFARAVWSAGDICQSLLANPTSNLQADKDRRAAFRQRNIDYNAELAAVCARYARCHWDGNAVFNYRFARSDVAGDYFHPSIQGQTNLAAVTWGAGYTWTTPGGGENLAPTARFTFDCTDLSCSFDGTASSDGDGTIAGYRWDFGDGAEPASGATVSHTYAAGGTYTVTLTVTDDDGAPDEDSQSVTVTAPSDGIHLSVSGSKIKGTKTADLTWSGAGGSSVVVYRDGAPIVTTENDGSYTDPIGKGGGTHTYRVCETDTTLCSADVSVSY